MPGKYVPKVATSQGNDGMVLSSGNHPQMAASFTSEILVYIYIYMYIINIYIYMYVCMYMIYVIMTPQDPPAIQVCLLSEPARRLGFGTLRRERPSWRSRHMG